MPTAETTLRSRRVVLPREGGLTVVPAAVTFAGGRIRAVTDADAVAPGPTVHDYGDRLVAPAFVDAHTHLPLAFLRGAIPDAVPDDVVEDLFFAHEGRLTAADVRAFARMGAYDALLSGTGFVWEHYYHGAALAEALHDVGLAGAVAPTLQDLAGPGATDWPEQLEATRAIDQDARLLAAGIVAAVGPHATDTVSADLWERSLELAASAGLPVHCHVAQSLRELQRVIAREGRPPLAWLIERGVLERAPVALLVHALFCQEDELSALRDTRHRLVLCPSSQASFAFVAPFERWLRMGLEFVVGTDAAASSEASNVQAELRAVARGPGPIGSAAFEKFFAHGRLDDARAIWDARPRDRARAPAALLRRVWDGPGRLHPRVTSGVLEPGALASVVVWDVDHPAFWPGRDVLGTLARGCPTAAIHAMWVAGRRIGEDGDFAGSVVRSAAYRQARAEAVGRLTRVMNRPG